MDSCLVDYLPLRNLWRFAPTTEITVKVMAGESGGGHLGDNHLPHRLQETSGHPLPTFQAQAVCSQAVTARLS